MDYVKIPLTKGYEAIIDAADFELVGHLNWYSMVSPHRSAIYAFTNLKLDGRPHEQPRSIFMHRILTKAPKGMVVDHINGDGLDNRRANLRVCSHRENTQNRRKAHGKIELKGVRLAPVSSKGKPQKYFTSMKLRNTLNVRIEVKFGTYKSLEEAAIAYDLAAKELYGEYAATNRDLGLLAHMSDWQYEQLGQWLLENTKLRRYIDRAKALRDGRVDLGYKGMAIEVADEYVLSENIRQV